MRQGQPGDGALSVRDQRERRLQWLRTPVKWIARIHVSSRGQPWDTRDVKSELVHRMNWVPEWALPRYDGHGAPWAQAYPHRLAHTEPLSYPVLRLIADGTLAQLSLKGRMLPAQRPASAVRYPRGCRETTGGTSTLPAPTRIRRRRPGGRCPSLGQTAQRPGYERAIRSVVLTAEGSHHMGWKDVLLRPWREHNGERVGTYPGACRRARGVRPIELSGRRRRLTRPSPGSRRGHPHAEVAVLAARAAECPWP